MKEKDAGASRRDAFPEFHIGDAAFVDAEVTGGGDPPDDYPPVFAQGCRDPDERPRLAGGGSVEPVGQRCAVAGVERGGELSDQVVGAVESRAVVEEPVQAHSEVGSAVAGTIGRDPYGHKSSFMHGDPDRRDVSLARVNMRYEVSPGVRIVTIVRAAASFG
ncbi:hypothetical protein [Embleya sp. AB8]|uniref:hypothetical protein n=1 Tax=Embleya sp. AB8 TaxID=3156304 RepID=UPI003C72E5FD